MLQYGKSCLLLLMCLATFCKSYANAIDSLNTKDDVIKFFSAIMGTDRDCSYLFRDEKEKIRIDPTWSEETIKQVRYNAEKKYRSNNFYKADIDNDGKTDLIIDGSSLCIITNTGDKYTVHYVNGGYGGFNMYYFKSVVKLADGSTAMLVLHDTLALYDTWKHVAYEQNTLRTDTLVMQFNNLTEYHKHSERSMIKKVCFTSMAYGCVRGEYLALNMELNRNDNACRIQPLDISAYQVYQYLGIKYDTLYASIDSATLSGLWNYMTYLDLASLKDVYCSHNEGDEPQITTVYFEDGTTKTITDYSYTFFQTNSLYSLYHNFFELSYAKNWQRHTPPFK